jgi:hypothetical protein
MRASISDGKPSDMYIQDQYNGPNGDTHLFKQGEKNMGGGFTMSSRQNINGSNHRLDKMVNRDILAKHKRTNESQKINTDLNSLDNSKQHYNRNNSLHRHNNHLNSLGNPPAPQVQPIIFNKMNTEGLDQIRTTRSNVRNQKSLSEVPKLSGPASTL